MLREELKDWADADVAMFFVAKSLGIIGEQSFQETKWVYWTGNLIRDSLSAILEQLVKAEILEERNEPDWQFRWNEKFEIKP